MTMHSTVVDANNNIVPRRIDENNSLGSTYALTSLDEDSNDIEITGKSHVVNTSTGAQTVTTITGGVKGQDLFLKASSTAYALTVTHTAAPTTDQVCVLDGSNFVSSNKSDFLRATYDGTYWMATKHNL